MYNITVQDINSGQAECYAYNSLSDFFGDLSCGVADGDWNEDQVSVAVVNTVHAIRQYSMSDSSYHFGDSSFRVIITEALGDGFEHPIEFWESRDCPHFDMG